MDPVILFFILGALAGLLKINLRLPSSIYEFLSMILLLAIGLKGGIELSKQSFGNLAVEMIVVVAMGIILPLIAYPILKKIGKFSRVDSASIAAHYGSVSVGTYAVAISYLTTLGIAYESYIPLFVVLLEIPAILIGIILVKGFSRDMEWGKLAHEVFLGKSVVLLVGGLLIGLIAGAERVEGIGELFFGLFKGVLALFLLEMGLIAASKIGVLRKSGLFLVAFGVLFPLFSGMVGSVLGVLLGLSLGGIMLFATLAASASYIAVPEANPTMSITASLAITFPFNVMIGIPIYLYMAKYFSSLIGV